ncbi:ricin-type beta-trefoil lectin domain protein [Vibrio quintilis]|nr:ricin-type beta-trefoil lectin domain protein [Vibrio quintilis]
MQIKSMMLMTMSLIAGHVAVAQHVIPENTPLTTDVKIWHNHTDKAFFDAYGREVTMRGFNVSGEVKLAESGFKAFKNSADASKSLMLLRQKTGVNMIRYTIAWEGIQPQPGQVDQSYLAAIAQQIQLAADTGFYILLDYHFDLYSRHTFTQTSADTGNGAPLWAVSDVYGKDDCGVVCRFSWAAHIQSDNAVRNAIRGFWFDNWALNQQLNDIELLMDDGNLCADTDQSAEKSSSTVMVQTCSGQQNQRWHYYTDGTIHSAKDDKMCLDVAGGHTAHGTDIQVYPCNQTTAQQFIIDAFGRIHPMVDMNQCVTNQQTNLELAACLAPSSSTLQTQAFTLREGASGTSLTTSMDFVQSQFVWQIGEVVDYLSAHLSSQQQAMILGINPFNEPFDGGIGDMSYSDWDNDILWPFYQRVRTVMTAHGWKDKPVYAEPNVFWSSTAGPVAPATGGHYLKYQPGDGFVFNAHLYDQGRMAMHNLSVVRNGAYFSHLDLIRDEARYLDVAPFLSEFGMWLDGWGHTDTERVVNGMYQAMESSDSEHGRNRYLDFYTPVVSGSQWHWDYYYDHHHELLNGNPEQVKTEDDGWNGENFSVIADYGQTYHVKEGLIQRAYPRAVQGNIMHFAYEGLVPDENGEVMSWRSIRASLDGKFTDREFFRHTRFAFLAWRGRKSDAPTEIYWPKQFTGPLTVITDAGIYSSDVLANMPEQAGNEVIVQQDTGDESGRRILIWDDPDAGETSNSFHFALLIDGDAGLAADEQQLLKQAVAQQLKAEKSPVYLTGTMTRSGYSKDMGR